MIIALCCDRVRCSVFFGHLISLHVPLETPKWRWLGFAAGRLSRRRGRRCRSLLPLGCGSSAQQKVYCYQTAVPHKVVICIFNGSALKGSVLWRCLPGGFPLRVCVKVCHRVLPLEGVLFSCFLSSPGWISFVLQPPHAQTCAACDTLRGLRYCLKKKWDAQLLRPSRSRRYCLTVIKRSRYQTTADTQSEKSS